ncbi:MAG: 3-oxoacyl-[acyl-carrier-protein] reductase [Saprospiraceae bacterium]|nr:3-oxoacyl-[acyl-carrier-protein] reductase [Bacteroidia bacterium]NNL93874.1 3-oxoacyl-[acyl-carrier-protein] reductase [Saprospiraceae bacterium]
MGLLEGKTALITGGSRGIGKAIVEKFISEGASVAFTYRSSAAASDEIIKDLNAGDKLKAYQSDASSYSAAESLIKSVMEDFGKIDILINNAGITKDTLMLRMGEEHWDQVMEINLKSVFNLTKHVLKPMLRNRGGSIINMSSVVGVFGNAGQANYAASKAGIIGFTKSIAKEVGSRGIRCNAIAPGFIASEMTAELDEKVQENYISSIPLKRFGSGDDVSNACLYLGSDLSTYVTGQVLSVCGGMNT